MSQEEAEDVKPKLNLNIAYDGTREGFFRLFTFGYSLKEIVNDLDITVKVKTNMKFAKIFEAAEVCCHSIFHLFRPRLIFCLHVETIWERTRSVPCPL
jgi:hypothetical protein